MSRLSVEDRVEKETGKSFADVLADYAEQRRMTPEGIATELGCSLSALLSTAAKKGFRVVRRLERTRY